MLDAKAMLPIVNNALEMKYLLGEASISIRIGTAPAAVIMLW
jgi:hypothetical protein